MLRLRSSPISHSATSSPKQQGLMKYPFGSVMLKAVLSKVTSVLTSDSIVFKRSYIFGSGTSTLPAGDERNLNSHSPTLGQNLAQGWTTRLTACSPRRLRSAAPHSRALCLRLRAGLRQRGMNLFVPLTPHLALGSLCSPRARTGLLSAVPAGTGFVWDWRIGRPRISPRGKGLRGDERLFSPLVTSATANSIAPPFAKTRRKGGPPTAVTFVLWATLPNRV
jgi:hypothetical protein